MQIRQLSDTAKEVLYNYFLEGDIEVMNALVDDTSDPRDKALARYCIAEYYLIVKKDTETFLNMIRELEEVNRQVNDLLLELTINYGYFALYSLWQVNQKLGDQYSHLIQATYEKIKYVDTWENNLVEGIYHFSYSRNTQGDRTREEIQRSIIHAEKGLEGFSKLGEKGQEIADLLSLYVGMLYFRLGNFEKAESLYLKSIDVGKKYNGFWLPSGLGALAWFYILTGDPHNAHKYNDLQLQIAKKQNLISILIYGLALRGKICQLEGKYEEALESLLECLKLREKLNQPMELFEGYYDLFNYHYEMYQVQDNSKYLQEAKKYFKKLQEIANHHSDIDRLTFLTHLTQALVLKHGTFKNKAQSVELLEQLMDTEGILRGDFLLISINLLDLLFENITLSDEDELVNQTERIIQKVEEIPLQTNPNALYYYVTQQILIAKYYYYLRNDVTRAIRTLTHVSEEMQQYKLKNIEQLIDKELRILAQEKQKWEGLETPLKERIIKAEFQSYLQDALRLVNYQPEQR
jgi:tetratricopeptide (TPR) repeat protein